MCQILYKKFHCSDWAGRNPDPNAKTNCQAVIGYEKFNEERCKEFRDEVARRRRGERHSPMVPDCDPGKIVDIDEPTCLQWCEDCYYKHLPTKGKLVYNIFNRLSGFAGKMYPRIDGSDNDNKEGYSAPPTIVDSSSSSARSSRNNSPARRPIALVSAPSSRDNSPSRGPIPPVPPRRPRREEPESEAFLNYPGRRDTR